MIMNDRFAALVVHGMHDTQDTSIQYSTMAELKFVLNCFSSNLFRTHGTSGKCCVFASAIERYMIYGATGRLWTYFLMFYSVKYTLHSP